MHRVSVYLGKSDFSDIHWGISRFLCGNLGNESWQKDAGERKKAVNFQCGTRVW